MAYALVRKESRMSYRCCWRCYDQWRYGHGKLVLRWQWDLMDFVFFFDVWLFRGLNLAGFALEQLYQCPPWLFPQSLLSALYPSYFKADSHTELELKWISQWYPIPEYQIRNSTLPHLPRKQRNKQQSHYSLNMIHVPPESISLFPFSETRLHKAILYFFISIPKQKTLLTRHDLPFSKLQNRDPPFHFLNLPSLALRLRISPFFTVQVLVFLYTKMCFDTIPL